MPHSSCNNFHLLRLSLAVLVMLSHGNWVFATGFTALPFHSAELAVNGFFIISGFLISWSIDRKFEWRGYAIKRFARIYPLYAVMILLQLCVMLYFSTIAVSGADIALYLAANLTTLNPIKPWIGDMVDFPFNGSLWTIKIEVMFYIALPFYVWFCKKLGLGAVLFTWLLAFLYRYWMDDYSVQLARQLPGAMTYFIAGYVLYHYGHIVTGWLRARFWHLPLCATILLLAYLLLPLDWGWRLIYVFALMVGIYTIAFYLPALPLRYDISYGIYLIHFPFFVTLRHVGFFAEAPLSAFVVGSIGVVMLSFAANRWIEEPAIRWGHRKAKHNETSRTEL